LDFVEDEIVNSDYTLRSGWNALEAMTVVAGRAAKLFGDWDSFFGATNYIFTGYGGTGANVMYEAHESTFSGYFTGAGDRGFNDDFRDNDAQIRHFWVALASAANPNGENPFGGLVANVGNIYHDVIEDWGRRPDTTVTDYQLSIVGIDIARRVGPGNGIETPNDLIPALNYSLGESGPGYIGPSINTWWWFNSPYEGE
jgi:hypothetical protein